MMLLLMLSNAAFIVITICYIRKYYLLKSRNLLLTNSIKDVILGLQRLGNRRKFPPDLVREKVSSAIRNLDVARHTLGSEQED